MPIPKIKHGRKSKERSRTKNKRWRKKRSDAGKPRTQVYKETETKKEVS